MRADVDDICQVGLRQCLLDRAQRAVKCLVVEMLPRFRLHACKMHQASAGIHVWMEQWWPQVQQRPSYREPGLPGTVQRQVTAGCLAPAGRAVKPPRSTDQNLVSHCKSASVRQPGGMSARTAESSLSLLLSSVDMFNLSKGLLQSVTDCPFFCGIGNTQHHTHSPPTKYNTAHSLSAQPNRKAQRNIHQQ